MTWQAWVTLGDLLVTITALIVVGRAPDMILWASVSFLLLTNVITFQDALSGLSNEGMVTVGVLFIVAAGLRETGAMAWLSGRLLGRPRSALSAQARLTLPTAAMSAFINNTPLVAMLLPVVSDWAKKHRIPVSKLLIPLSYATILGGVCTLIGTSTNIVVNGLLMSQVERMQQKGAADPAFLHPMGMFELTRIGLPIAVVGLGYMRLASRWLLPDRRSVVNQLGDTREYSTEMVVMTGSPLVGQTIEQAGLRHLPGLYLMEIERGGRLHHAVSPEEKLQSEDRLVFVGVVDSVIDLQKIRGLAPATEQIFKLDSPRAMRCLIEAVVSNSSPMVGQTIRESRFRSVYNAVVIAVSRNGERIRRKIGDIVVRAGDTLLVEAPPAFIDQHRNNRDFYLVSRVEGATLPSHEKAWAALLILGGMVALASTGAMSMLQAALLAAVLMVLTGCLRVNAARSALEWPVLLMIAAAFGLGKAMEKTGLAGVISGGMLDVAGQNPHLCLAAVYGMTILFTELMGHNSAAVLVFPIAVATAATLGCSAMPFVIAVTVAASCSFITPIGYQTNLMVYGPGGYKFSDFVRFGVPLTILVFLISMIGLPIAFPFH